MTWRMAMAVVFCVLVSLSSRGQEPKTEESPALGDPQGLKRITKDYDIWIDEKRNAVIVDGEVCLREGQLELFACPKMTKEHEAVVAVNAKPRYVHGALLAVGAERVGAPVKFDPKYAPATGQIIDIWVLWKDAKGENQKAKAQDWIKHVKTGKPMEYNFVFAGSGLFKDDDGKEYYHADGSGDFICVSNFPTAMLDLPIKSSAEAGEGLLFVANTEKIPPKGTKVRLVLIPRPEKKDEKK